MDQMKRVLFNEKIYLVTIKMTVIKNVTEIGKIKKRVTKLQIHTNIMHQYTLQW